MQRLSRRRLVWQALLALMLFAALALAAGPAAGLEPEEEEESKDADVYVLIDQSGSMFQESDRCTYQGTQAIGLPLRQWAAAEFIDFLGVEPSGERQVGVIYFGAETKEKLSLFKTADLTASEAAKETIKQGNCPEDLGWTNVNKALEAAIGRLGPKTEDRQKIILMLTDGVPELDDDWYRGAQEPALSEAAAQKVAADKTAYYTRHFELIEQCRQQGIRVYIVALGDRAKLVDPALDEMGILPPDAIRYGDLWNHAATETGGRYFPVASADDLSNAFHAIAVDLTGLTDVGYGRGTTSGETTVINFMVPKGAVQLFVQAKRDPTVPGSGQTKSSLFDPSNAVQAAARSDEQYDIYKVAQPLEGQWTIKFEGPGMTYEWSVSMDVDLRIDAVDLPGVHPLNQPLKLRLQVARKSDKEPVQAQLTANVTLGNSGNLIPMSPVEGVLGAWSGTWTPTVEGDYTLLFTATEGQMQASEQRTVAVREMLYLELLEPAEGSYLETAEVKFALKMGQEKVAAVGTGSSQPKVTIELLDPSDTAVSTLDLSSATLGADNAYTVVVQDVEKGDYAFRISLEAPELGGQDSQTVRFHLSPPPTREPTPTPTAGTPQCVQNAFGPAVARRSETFVLETVMDTSQLRNPVVLSAAVSGQAADQVEILNPSPTLKPGNAQEPVRLELRVRSTAQLQPGKNTLLGTVEFSGQEAPLFCAMTFSVDVFAQRCWLPEAALEGKAPGEVTLELEYDTADRTTDEPVSLALEGFDPGLIRLDPESATITLPAGQHSRLSTLIQVEESAVMGADGPERSKTHQGKLVVRYSDGTTDEIPLSITVEPRSILEKLWPILAAVGALLVGGVLFLVLDPTGMRNKLTGELVYLNQPKPAIRLVGRQQKVVLNEPDPYDPRIDGAVVAVLMARARKKGRPPVVDVQRASGGVDIANRPCREGDKGIELPPDAIVEAGPVMLKYESMLVAPPASGTGGVDYGSPGYGSGGFGSTDYGSTGYDSSSPLGGPSAPADSQPLNPYDASLPPSGPSTGPGSGGGLDYT